MKVHQFDRQRIVNYSDAGKILSITPIYEEGMNKYNTFYSLCNELSVLSEKYPTEKFVSELNNTPENQYEMIKSDIGLGDNFTDHSQKFFYNVAVNAVLIVHKEY